MVQTNIIKIKNIKNKNNLVNINYYKDMINLLMMILKIKFKNYNYKDNMRDIILHIKNKKIKLKNKD